jgi:hypothetical protein
VRVPLPAEDFSIAGPCFLWHLADVVWKSDGTGALQEVGTPGTREFGYWGRLSPGSFSCAANTDPGLPAGYRPGTVPEYQ